MPAEWLSGSVLKIFEGQSTCCERKHIGTKRCDRETLVQPLLGMCTLFAPSHAESMLHTVKLQSVTTRIAAHDARVT